MRSSRKSRRAGGRINADPHAVRAANLSMAISRYRMSDESHTPVLIVGAGLTGLSSGVFLRSQGISCLLVERHPSLLVHPRLHGITNRTLEVYHQCGVGSAVATASERRVLHAVRAESLASESWERIHTGGEVLNAIDQHTLETMLHAEAERRGVEIRFNTELTSFSQGEEGVSAVVRERDTGVETTVRAKYLIAADGADSPIRNRLGIDCDGPGSIEHRLTALFEADLDAAIRDRRFRFAHLSRPRPGTIVWPAGPDGRRWRFSIGREDNEELVDYPEERLAEMIRQAVGLPDLELEFVSPIPGRDVKVLELVFGAQVARRYSDRRVFLIGDAAHVMPPPGGFGAGAGIQDTHNLAWKLAAVLRGQAAPSLLDTYHVERHPVGELTVQQAMAQMAERLRTLRNHDLPPIAPHAAVDLGYQYRSKAVPGALDSSGDAPLLTPDELRGRPGTRAPDVSMNWNGQARSTLELYGSRFVVLGGVDSGPWLDASRKASDSLAIPIDAYRFGCELESAAGSEAHGIGSDGALLVRPDGFVAWRAETASADPARALRDVMAGVLGR
jgi:putative polyketide hydroxylase